jgi:hypothetical protein
MVYRGKIVETTIQEFFVNDAIRPTSSADREMLEVNSGKEVVSMPMKQIKSIACDASIFSTKK